MPNHKKQTPPKKSVERIIPIQLEDSDSKVNKASKSFDGEVKLGTQSDKQENLNVVSSGDISDDSNVSTNTTKSELADNEECNITSEQDIELKIPERMLPPHNVPERIIIVLDRAEDEISTLFELPNGNKVKPLHILKDSLKFFLSCKSSFNDRHQFALVTLDENSATWVHNFTNNPRSIIGKLDDIDECQTEDIFDIGTVLNLIIENVEVPVPKSDLLIPPPYIVRVIFLYNRSITMPQIKRTEEIDKLLDSPYFTFDVIMTHETPDSSNKCNLIFKELQQLDTKGFAYFFPVSRNASLLQESMAKLLGHPLQRCAQKDANYKMN